MALRGKYKARYDNMTAKDAHDMMEKLAKQATPQHMAELMIDVEKEYRAGDYKGHTPTQATMIKCRLMYLLGAFEVLEHLTNEGATLSDVLEKQYADKDMTAAAALIDIIMSPVKTKHGA